MLRRPGRLPVPERGRGMFNKRDSKSDLWIVFFLLIILSGCGDSLQSKTTDSRIVAYVNKEPVFASEVDRAIAIKARQDPLFKVTPESKKEQLDTIIDKKLIIQEAVKSGLTRDEKFVNTIKTFWEQTLVREFVDYKRKDFIPYLFVTENEVKNYYARLGRRVSFRVWKDADKAAIEKIYGQIRGGAVEGLPAAESVGPVSYSEISADVLREAFDAALGEAKVLNKDGLYYLIVVDSRNDTPLPPLETLRQEIGQEILAKKEQELLDDWLIKQRQQAGVKMVE